MKTRHYALVVGLPVIAIALFWWIETSLQQPSIEPSLTSLTDMQKQAIELSQDLARFFTTFAVSLIGAVGFYLRLERPRSAKRNTYSLVLIAATIFASVLSIFFGHLWMAKLRGELTTDILNFHATELLWPERLQYFFFIASLIWFALLVIDREIGDPSRRA